MPSVKWTGLLLLMLVSGCASGPGINPCTEFDPIYLSTRDVLTDETVKSILRFNEKWEALCQ